VAPQPLKDVFLISEDSGLRPDETIRMRWDYVLWDKNLIFNPYGKTEKARRYVPLSYRVRNLLRARAQGATSSWVFPSRRKKDSHISYFPIAKQFSMVRKALSLPKDLVLYSARHTFAADMHDKTGNLSLVQKMLGHESITTTQRYLHPELKDVAELVNQRNAENAEENLRHSPGLTQRGRQLSSLFDLTAPQAAIHADLKDTYGHGTRKYPCLYPTIFLDDSGRNGTLWNDLRSAF
jgi:integrase